MNKLSSDFSPCRTCKKMVCRTHTRDCHGVHDESLAVYLNDDTALATAHAASRLVDNGRAGSLNRIEEIIEYCHDREFRHVGVAYCFGMKQLAIAFCEMLENADLVPIPVSCTSGAVLEREVDTRKEGDVVSCNPAGQAIVLNQKKPDLVVEMGLCLGHDMIFHQTIDVPFTVLLVKDRTVGHHTASLLPGYVDANSQFLETLDNSFGMKSPQWLSEKMTTGDSDLTIIDFRSVDAFENGHIPGSIQMPLKELPGRCSELNRKTDVVCVCNGSVQSAYGIMFLYSRGFRHVHNLSGGFARWERDGFPVDRHS